MGKIMDESKRYISSLEKGLLLINSFLPENRELSLSEIARANGMNLGTTHRYVLTLKKLGYVAQNQESKKYRLTPKLVSMGFSILRGMDLRSRVFPYMMEMAKEFDTTSQCAILHGHEIIYIERVRSQDVVNLDLSVGSRLPAHCTSMGKVILAFLGEKERKRIVKQMKLLPLTPYTITDRKKFLQELDLTRQRGYAVNSQELTAGLRTIAVPIFNAGPRVEAAFGLSYPVYRVEGNDLEETYARRLLEISKLVSIDQHTS
jgi:IclR family transcriptional regulator, pca regulon regulatory protein